MQKHNLEALKELGRIVLLDVYAAVVPALIVIFAVPPEQQVAVLKTPLTYIILAQRAISAALKTLDKRRHIQGKLEEDPNKELGLAGF